MSTTVGPSSTATAPTLSGVWMHSVADPDGSERSYLYQTAGRAEAITVQQYALQFVGRTFPVVEYGEQEAQALKLSMMVPWSDSHDDDVEQMRSNARARATLVYRDNRGRLMFGYIDGELDLNDELDGTSIAMQFTRSDYVEGS